MSVSDKYYIKWGNEHIGVVFNRSMLITVSPEHPCNKVLEPYYITPHLAKMDIGWELEDRFIVPKHFEEFVANRIPSRERKDIVMILENMGLEEYDWFKISLETRLFHPADKLWIAKDLDETFEETLPEVLKNIFIDGASNRIANASPGGVNKKYYASYNGCYGIIKERLNRLSDDVECEVSVYKLSKLFDIPCCETSLVYPEENHKSKDVTVFSKFEYKVGSDLFVHFSSYWENKRFTIKDILNDCPELAIDLCKMVYFDFITRQTDRHLNNFAVYYDGSGEPSFYPLYDNGRSLFYNDGDDIEFMLDIVVRSPELNSPMFGNEPLIYAVRACKDYCKPSDVLNLNVTREQIEEVLNRTQRSKSRIPIITDWIMNSIRHLKGM